MSTIDEIRKRHEFVSGHTGNEPCHGIYAPEAHKDRRDLLVEIDRLTEEQERAAKGVGDTIAIIQRAHSILSDAGIQFGGDIDIRAYDAKREIERLRNELAWAKQREEVARMSGPKVKEAVLHILYMIRVGLPTEATTHAGEALWALGVGR